MSKKIIVDASYPENIQVVVVDNKKLEEFEYSSSKKTIKGNIYLAKVTRVEPALQAAFIDYGDDKHGFISFAEIQSTYYDIPTQLQDAPEKKTDSDLKNDEEGTDNSVLEGEHDATSDEDLDEIKRENAERYKIQEVIKRNQVLLVQAIKEERGNKGASFTTYVSLAGRYCIIMPNSGSKGGVSRKILDVSERRRLKAIIDNTESLSSAGMIIRTAGEGKADADIQEDYNCLVRLWNDIRQKILTATAPSFVYAEDDLLKRVIRDMYDNKTAEIIVQGEEAYAELENIVKSMSFESGVKLRKHRENTPVFCKFKIDEQIASLYDPVAHMSSGSYIVINHTEALIAIDVNSGKSTSERNVEETAVKTNIEAAKEIARQIKLRDLSGIIVVDFIDMVESKNRKMVERTLRDKLNKDRAKVQVGYISNLGLLEISRQRLKSNFLEANAIVCDKCCGKGVVRSGDVNSVMILKTIEGEISNGNFKEITIFAAPETTMHILNNKREDIKNLETKYDIKITFDQDAHLSSDGFAIEALEVDGRDRKNKSPSSHTSDVQKIEPNTVKPISNRNFTRDKQKPHANKKTNEREKSEEHQSENQRVEQRKPSDNGSAAQEAVKDATVSSDEQASTKKITRRRPAKKKKFDVKTKEAENITESVNSKEDSKTKSDES